MSWTKDDDDEAVRREETRKSSEEVRGYSEGAQRRMLGEEVVTPASEVISCLFCCLSFPSSCFISFSGHLQFL